LRQLEAVADYFVICTGDVDQQVRAIVENIEKQIKTATGERVLHREGMDTLNWVLLDYVDVVVHVFQPSFREFYRLEDLWGDAEVVEVNDEQEAIPRPRASRRRVAVAGVKPETVKPKAPAKKTVAQKVAAKKAAAKKTVAKPKSAAKTASGMPVRKTAVKKSAVKKTAVKKSVPKAAPKKVAPKKTAPKRPRKS
jgi:ribosome-associated protein